ncbi:hypothetical protein LF1_53840 [Rubripirellula obstinata]|uniref:Uncharacterized protein n=1 Tax=Rubripirellula obstinata TaxID=406547 RepID=A0A5B1CB79_9BACT|nr:hypothetical protein LF1_53840 [Rubripirellula obstinata]
MLTEWRQRSVLCLQVFSRHPQIATVIRPGVPGPRFTLQSNANCKFRLVFSSLTPVPRIYFFPDLERLR